MKKSKNKDVVMICKVNTVNKNFGLKPFSVFQISENDKYVFHKRAIGSFDMFFYWIKDIKTRKISIHGDEFFELDNKISKKINDEDFKVFYTEIINYIQKNKDDDMFYKFIHSLRKNKLDFSDFLYALEAEYVEIINDNEELLEFKKNKD